MLQYALQEKCHYICEVDRSDLLTSSSKTSNLGPGLLEGLGRVFPSMDLVGEIRYSVDSSSFFLQPASTGCSALL